MTGVEEAPVALAPEIGDNGTKDASSLALRVLRGMQVPELVEEKSTASVREFPIYPRTQGSKLDQTHRE